MTLFGFGKASAGPPPDPDDAVDVGAPPLTHQDYARTTTDSPESTALIPAIKDDPTDDGGDLGEPTEAIAPVAADSPPAAMPPPAATHVPTPATVAPVPEPVASPVQPSVARGPVALRLVRVEPYSVTRLAFVVSVALMIVATVAVAIFWLVLAVTGVWGQINESVASLLSDDSASFDIKDYLGFTRMVGGTLVVSGINVILMTALATVGAHLYNLAAALLGGVETTFSED